MGRGARVMTHVAKNVHCKCTELFWTAYITDAVRIHGIGRGHTQEEAIDAALRSMGAT